MRKLYCSKQAGLLYVAIMMIMLCLLPNRANAQGRCIGLLPPDDFCGCTWGTVLYEGEPVSDTVVSLNFNGEVTSTITALDDGLDNPIYGMSAIQLPNGGDTRRGITFTLNANYFGERITRTVRALPGFEPESVYEGIDWDGTDSLQQVILPIPDRGTWTALDTVSGYAATIVPIGDTEWVGGAIVQTTDTVWMGGASGVLERSLEDATMTTHDFAKDILDMAIDSAGDVWALVFPSAQSPDQLYRYNEGSWETVTIPIRAIRVVDNPTTGGIVIGGWFADGSGAIAEYVDGAWRDPVAVPDDVYAVAVDHMGGIWAGTLDNGVYRFNDNGQEHFEVTNGLPTNIIFDIATNDTAVYVAGEPSGGATGTIGRYDLATGEWQTWPLEGSGLPEGTIVSRLAVSDDDDVFAITAEGIHQLSGDSWWRTRPVENEGITALTTDGVDTFAAGEQLYQFDPDAFIGVPPVATIVSATIEAGLVISLTGSGDENEPDDAHIVGWEWMSDDTLLCSSARCEIRPHEIEVDICADQTSAPVSFRVQDDEGEWSDAAETTIECPPTITLAVSLRTNTTTTTITPWLWLITVMLLGISCVRTVRHE